LDPKLNGKREKPSSKISSSEHRSTGTETQIQEQQEEEWATEPFANVLRLRAF